MATKSTTKKKTTLKAKDTKKAPKEAKAPKKAVKAPKKEVKKAAPKKVETKKPARPAGGETLKEKKATSFDGKYFYAVGKRKTAVAQIRIYPAKKSGKMIVNEKEMEKYFPMKRLQDTILDPFIVCGQEGKFDFSAKVNGGGFNAQADAIRLGISRALLIFDEELRKSLRAAGFLTRDARKVERKKPGKKKARRSPQFSKR